MASAMGLRRWKLRCPTLRCPIRRSRGTNAAQACHLAESSKAVTAASPPAQNEEEGEEDRLCRFCFEGDEEDELISPCRCSGGQKYVHLKCLRMWQRAVLVSQPTHPDLYDHDTRQRICNVCKTEFTCHPPTRAELLASFTGPELAALIEERCFIGSAENFSRELERQVASFPGIMREGIVCLNWIRGLFLIVKVVEDRHRGIVMLRISDDEELSMFLQHLEADARTFHLRGRRYQVLPQGPLKNLTDQDSPEARRELMRSVRTPASIRLRPDPVDCGEDGIVAVNLARPFDLASSGRTVLRARQRAAYQAAVSRVLSDRGGSDLRAQVTHFIGGPCEEEKVACCIVVSSSGYSIVQDDACLLAGLSVAEELASTGGAAAEGAAAALRLSAIEAGAGISSISTIDTDEGKEDASSGVTKRRRIELEEGSPSSNPAHDPSVRVFVYWGYAGWSRCQLMGEIARGSWGLCKANTQDVVSKSPDEVWHAVYPRLVFAPRSEMSESYGGESPEEEERRQQLRRMAIIHDLLTGRQAAREEEEEATNEAEEEEVQDGAQERAALAEELEAADASESEEEAEESAPIVTDEDVSGEECEGMVQPVPQTVTAQE
mmetsp:Transcript_47608/g.113320  ORF Transcript_47608/g.113320 Transcript_47608/m.113320 type:complete len:607 (+) Transcript_47608:60-1880(+)